MKYVHRDLKSYLAFAVFGFVAASCGQGPHVTSPDPLRATAPLSVEPVAEVEADDLAEGAVVTGPIAEMDASGEETTEPLAAGSTGVSGATGVTGATGATGADGEITVVENDATSTEVEVTEEEPLAIDDIEAGGVVVTNGRDGMNGRDGRDGRDAVVPCVTIADDREIDAIPLSTAEMDMLRHPTPDAELLLPYHLEANGHALALQNYDERTGNATLPHGGGNVDANQNAIQVFKVEYDLPSMDQVTGAIDVTLKYDAVKVDRNRNDGAGNARRRRWDRWRETESLCFLNDRVCSGVPFLSNGDGWDGLINEAFGMAPGNASFIQTIVGAPGAEIPATKNVRLNGRAGFAAWNATSVTFPLSRVYEGLTERNSTTMRDALYSHSVETAAGYRGTLYFSVADDVRLSNVRVAVNMQENSCTPEQREAYEEALRRQREDARN